MAEYIDREALIKEIEKGIVFSGRLNSRMLRAELRGANLVVEKVKIAPTADVIPVVRCKDCVNYGICCHHKEECGGIFDDDDFCSYGERKNE